MLSLELDKIDEQSFSIRVGNKLNLICQVVEDSTDFLLRFKNNLGYDLFTQAVKRFYRNLSDPLVLNPPDSSHGATSSSGIQVTIKATQAELELLLTYIIEEAIKFCEQHETDFIRPVSITDCIKQLHEEIEAIFPEDFAAGPSMNLDDPAVALRLRKTRTAIYQDPQRHRELDDTLIIKRFAALSMDTTDDDWLVRDRKNALIQHKSKTAAPIPSDIKPNEALIVYWKRKFLEQQVTTAHTHTSTTTSTDSMSADTETTSNSLTR